MHAGVNALDLVYTNIPSAYRAEPRPHLGYSDHISVMLIPAYRPLVRRSKPVLKQVRTWPSGAISALQDCFEHTDWQMFREAATYSTTTDLEEYTSSVTSYIGKCIDDVTVSKTITTRPNQKPWMTAEVRALLKARDSALRKARAKLSRGIREAKRTHGQSIHSHFRDSGDTRRMWQGIQAITNYRTAPPACDSDASLPDALNHFYARFETQNSVAARKTTPPPDDQVLCLTAADVRKTLRRVNPRKAAGPDNIPARVLRECADHLQHLPEQCHRPNMSQGNHHHPYAEEVFSVLPQRLPCCTHTHHHEVLREACHEAHLDLAASFTRSSAVCIPSQPLNGRRHIHHPSPGAHPPGR
ncbi:hypothetical protein NFI96_032455 [Prochilodus magdalenae]|nr:hypothetical protein NFI96_032455 [Prochilodus magdalenae]